MSSTAKVTWVVVAILALLGVGYLASRVGNLAARGVRDESQLIAVSLSTPAVPGVSVKASWNTALGQESGPVVLRGRGVGGEVVIGRGEFAAGQALVTIPCEMGGQEVGVSLYAVSSQGEEELLAWTSVNVLPSGPDCLR